ncbi:2-C-methyl-D-erythritol 4-phosphate cytidylyltransferase [Usitatibacter rugosus]|uniref:2-C-methyl-D-erythritol 4-phosphate cytidylyltransferase n=1 Tax=Usitatibacter rugosus TaxID=2732067 RepID=A0A6M4GYD2_9PROT|nr:2-C-methyl-D-erythritol 4-phosphate cytidylyltransferase [Usitatibacter rugosus]QJR11514.1 2-C-methyl-D-erythritol 4-phosphate cytidylyltransferase [Usitatibacter rugosus]
MPKIFALVPAAGQGTRIGDAVPKQYIPLAGKPMMFHALETLASVSRIHAVIAILAPLDRHWGEYDWSEFPEKIEAVFSGGKNRAESVTNALAHLDARIAKDDWVLVHDAARPCITKSLLEQFLDEVENDPVGGLLAMPLADTLKRAEETLRVAETIPRDGLWRAQTPQMFRCGLLRRSLAQRPESTDESSAVEQMLGNAPKLVQGDNTNLKVTFAEDLELAEMILLRRQMVEA